MALSKGAKGEAVKELQTALNRAGCKLDVDGSFGPATDKAVRDFQALYGLEEVGVAGPKTMAMLEEVRLTMLGRAVDKCLSKLEALPEYKAVLELI